MSMKYLLAHYPGVHIWSLLGGGIFCRYIKLPINLIGIVNRLPITSSLVFCPTLPLCICTCLVKIATSSKLSKGQKKIARVEQCEKEAHSFHLFVSHSVPTPWVSLHLATSTNRQTAPDGGESGVELEEEEEQEEQESSNQPRTLPCPRWSWSRTRASCNFIPSVVH